jgi:hypothetical protein
MYIYFVTVTVFIKYSIGFSIKSGSSSSVSALQKGADSPQFGGIINL